MQRNCLPTLNSVGLMILRYDVTVRDLFAQVVQVDGRSDDALFFSSVTGGIANRVEDIYLYLLQKDKSFGSDNELY